MAGIIATAKSPLKIRDSCSDVGHRQFRERESKRCQPPESRSEGFTLPD